MEYQKIEPGDDANIEKLSAVAVEIVKDYYDGIIGPAMNDYMIEMFQRVPAIRHQLKDGYRYWFVKKGESILGFFAYYPRGEMLYLSKFYLYKDQCGKGYGRHMLAFLVNAAKDMGLKGIELNVNRGNPTTHVYEKFGFKIVREEDNDIGGGFIMDDYIYALEI